MGETKNKEWLKTTLESAGERFKIISFTALIMALLSYTLLIITGVTCPDGICEGLTYYTAAGWASSNGRWAIRYLSRLTGNVVMPVVVVSIYCICICIVALMLTDLLEIRKRVSIILMTSIMIVSPSVIAHFLYTYMALAYSIACMLAAFFVWILYKGRKKHKYLLAVSALTVSLGLYQSYIGFTILLIVLLFCTELIECVSWKTLGMQIAEYIVCGGISCGLYIVIMKIDLKIHDLSPASRTASFSLKTIIDSLYMSIINAYKTWGAYFDDRMFHRNFIYLLFLLIAFLFLCVYLLKLYKQKKYINMVLLIFLICMIPVAANFIGIIIPEFKIYLLMQYQYVLIFVFFIGILERIDFKNKWIYILKAMEYLLVCFIAWTYLISANATYTCYKLSYNHINFETSLILADIYKLPDYVPSETPVIFAGFPNAYELVENVDTYKYAIYYTNNPVFWEDMNGAKGNRYWYLMNYFGVDGKNFKNSEYEDIIYSDEFAQMPVWPKQGSIKMINEMVVVKFTDAPPAVSTMPQ